MWEQRSRLTSLDSRAQANKSKNKFVLQNSDRWELILSRKIGGRCNKVCCTALRAVTIISSSVCKWRLVGYMEDKKVNYILLWRSLGSLNFFSANFFRTVPWLYDLFNSRITYGGTQQCPWCACLLKYFFTDDFFLDNNKLCKFA